MNKLFSLPLVLALALPGLVMANHDGMGDHCMRKDKTATAMPADANHDGVLDWEEAHDAFVRHFDEMDTNQDGMLSADEMKNCCCMQGKHCKSDGKCKDGKCKRDNAAHKRGDRTFAAADKDKDGTLDRQEAKRLPRVYKNFDAIDVDKDGTVDREEVHNFMSGHRH